MQKERLIVQSYVLSRLTGYLYKQGFVWLLPVVLSKTTDPLFPDPSGSVEKSLEVEVYGQRLMLTQSMIVHKQYMISQGIDRLFILSPNIRIEKESRKNTGKHLFEFTQLDFEIANFNDVQARRFIEKMITASLRYIKIDMNSEMKTLNPSFKIPKGPFKEYRYGDLVKQYGDDWEEKFIASINSPSWVIDIPRYFYDMQDQEGVWRNYDLYVPKYGEILSGGQREYNYNRLVEKMERDKINKEKYKVLLDLAQNRMLRPSAGAGLGIERFLMWITGADNIAEVQPFPRVPGTEVIL